MAPSNKYYETFVNRLSALDGKVIAITGTTSGTGYWTAVAAVRKNARAIFLLNRKSQRSSDSIEKLLLERNSATSSTELFQVECDLMSFASVRQAAKFINEKCADLGGLDVLLNNAGILGHEDIRTEDGFDLHMQVNHLSQFLLTKLLLPSLEQASNLGNDVRIVQHSSGARNFQGISLKQHFFQKVAEGTLGGNGFMAVMKRYHQTKLANSTFMLKLHKEFQERTLKIKSIAAQPGVALTGPTFNLAEAQRNPSFSMRLFSRFFSFAANYFMKAQTPADGSCSLIHAGFGENVHSGDFYEPEFTTYGLPIAIIEQGHANKKNAKTEKSTFDKNNQDNVWQWSEEAIGAKFFS